jgi:hypothetical protein
MCRAQSVVSDADVDHGDFDVRDAEGGEGRIVPFESAGVELSATRQAR